MALFNLNTKIPSVQGAQVLQPPFGLPNPQNNIFIFGNRRNPTASETTGLPILDPAPGFPLYEYFLTYQLPTQFLNNPLGMLSYFSSCGFTVGYGYSADISLLNASAVDILTLADENKAIVYYTNGAQLVQPLVGASITGTFDDTTAVVTGDFVSAAVGEFEYLGDPYDSYIILHSTGFADITAGDDIDISFVDSSLLIPDANTTEPFIMDLYQAIVGSLIPLNANSTVATPNVYFSILPNTAKSGYFGPFSSSITTSVPTLGGTTTIRFGIPSNNVSYIPLTELGNSTLTQAVTNATGTIVSAEINGGSLIVTLKDVTGTFNATNVVTLDLDPTQTVFVYQQDYFANKKISLQQLALPYAINSSTDITTTYKPAFDYVAALNLPQTSQDGQAVCFLVFGNLTIAPNLAVTDLPQNVNNYQYEPVYYPYIPVIGNLPLSAGQLSAAFAMVVGSNVSPLNPQGGVIINGLPVLTDPSKYLSSKIGGISDQVMKIGWNTITVNNNLQAYIINPITGQTTLPGLPTPDKEFFNTYVWQTLDYLRKGVTNICLNIGLGQVRQNPTILSILKAEILSLMITMQDLGMLLNVLENESFITIIQSPDNPLGIDIQIPTQVVPGLQQIYYTINVFSSTVTLATAA